MNDDAVVRNRALQTEWYGEPLGDRFRRLLDRLTLSQAQLADVLGLSAPMISQLMNGVRAKISNPAVLARLAIVEQMAADPAFVVLPPTARSTELARLVHEAPTASSSVAIAHTATPSAPSVGDPVAAVQGVLRAVASASDLDGAARLLDAEYPALAEVLRVYGTFKTADARAHYERTAR
ncbi:transcriptional regulator, XRE family [Catenulispora acidiphila DSM 44928]|uniref:Transcriptional regulator, XRE family n=1 Tax=Catenulispora acidiphila (strain DSM 44928 / JCM 14897 / NBRC 102108 / NRRL B-24433 / ID139908) TaxID=479433 RepID=C7QDN1_CATAD|nr:helix-turn-helix domain-containing protein [Catenulispora acidiphila]ACU74655.1 transcriptional regulator, XRE family [Catenulispora acidiphila DSM 44928]